jgi:hypothetical protein
MFIGGFDNRFRETVFRTVLPVGLVGHFVYTHPNLEPWNPEEAHTNSGDVPRFSGDRRIEIPVPP